MVPAWMASICMNALDDIVYRELPVIQQIIHDETWLEAERRGCHVLSNDRVVREKVCQVVLRIGQQLREAAQRAMDSAKIRRG
jgi:hypothetical protein